MWSHVPGIAIWQTTPTRGSNAAANRYLVTLYDGPTATTIEHRGRPYDTLSDMTGWINSATRPGIDIYCNVTGATAATVAVTAEGSDKSLDLTISDRPAGTLCCNWPTATAATVEVTATGVCLTASHAPVMAVALIVDDSTAAAVEITSTDMILTITGGTSASASTLHRADFASLDELAAAAPAGWAMVAIYGTVTPTDLSAMTPTATASATAMNFLRAPIRQMRRPF